MPFNGSNRIEALFAFVDQYVAGDPAMRSGFDQVFGDVVESVNAAITYLEDLANSGSTTDQRYLGLVVTVPTERLDASALQAGDFYVSDHADAGRVGLAYVYDGAAFDVVSDFSTIGDFFKDTLSAAATTAAARSALELGSAATQNSTAFAAASVATDVALAIKLLADGIAKSMTSNDWDNAHLAGPGTTMVQANAAALNAPVALNAAGIYVAYDASNGFVLAVAHSTGQVYYRMRVAATWGTWREIPTANSTAAEGDILYRAASAWTRLARGADRTVLTLVGGIPAWEARRIVLGPYATTSGSSVLVTGIPSWTKKIKVKLHAGDLSASAAIWRLQIGPSGGVETSGYVGASTWYYGNETGGGVAFAAGFDLDPYDATDLSYASWTLEETAANIWAMEGSLSSLHGSVVGNGRKTTAGTVDRLALSPSTGTFIAGEFYVVCEA